MPRFIEEFYYGNIDPQARSTKENGNSDEERRFADQRPDRQAEEMVSRLCERLGCCQRRIQSR